MAIARVPLGGHGQAETAKDKAQGLDVEMGSPVLPAARCLLCPGVHKALSSPPKTGAWSCVLDPRCTQ